MNLRSRAAVAVHAERPGPVGQGKQTDADERGEINQGRYFFGAQEQLRRVISNEPDRQDIGKGEQVAFDVSLLDAENVPEMLAFPFEQADQ
jgi:hypothetical protein